MLLGDNSESISVRVKVKKLVDRYELRNSADFIDDCSSQFYRDAFMAGASAVAPLLLPGSLQLPAVVAIAGTSGYLNRVIAHKESEREKYNLRVFQNDLANEIQYTLGQNQTISLVEAHRQYMKVMQAIPEEYRAGIQLKANELLQEILVVHEEEISGLNARVSLNDAAITDLRYDLHRRQVAINDLRESIDDYRIQTNQNLDTISTQVDGLYLRADDLDERSRLLSQDIKDNQYYLIEKINTSQNVLLGQISDAKREVLDSNYELQKNIESINTWVDECKAQRDAEIRQRKIAQKYNTLSQAGGFLSELGRVSECKELASMGVIISCSAELGRVHNALTSPNIEVTQLLALSSAFSVGMIVLSLYSSFVAKQQADPVQIQLNAVLEQLGLVREEMHKRFDQLGRQVADLGKALARSTQQIMTYLYRLDARLDSIDIRIKSIESTVSNIHNLLIDLRNDNLTQAFNTHSQRIMLADQGDWQFFARLSRSEYENMHYQCGQNALLLANNMIINGRNFIIRNHSDTLVLRGWYEEGARSLQKKIGFFAKMFVGLVDSKEGLHVPQPFLWLQAARTYIALRSRVLSFGEDNFEHTNADERSSVVKQFISEGHAILNFFNTVRASDTLYKRLFKSYELAVNECVAILLRELEKKNINAYPTTEDSFEMFQELPVLESNLRKNIEYRQDVIDCRRDLNEIIERKELEDGVEKDRTYLSDDTKNEIMEIICDLLNTQVSPLFYAAERFEPRLGSLSIKVNEIPLPTMTGRNSKPFYDPGPRTKYKITRLDKIVINLLFTAHATHEQTIIASIDYSLPRPELTFVPEEENEAATAEGHDSQTNHPTSSDDSQGQERSESRFVMVKPPPNYGRTPEYEAALSKVNDLIGHHVKGLRISFTHDVRHFLETQFDNLNARYFDLKIFLSLIEFMFNEDEINESCIFREVFLSRAHEYFETEKIIAKNSIEIASEIAQSMLGKKYDRFKNSVINRAEHNYDNTLQDCIQSVIEELQELLSYIAEQQHALVFQRYCSEGNVNEVRELLAEQPFVLGRRCLGKLPLDVAIESGHGHVVLELIKQGVSSNSNSLVFALQHNRRYIAYLLRNRGRIRGHLLSITAGSIDWYFYHLAVAIADACINRINSIVGEMDDAMKNSLLQNRTDFWEIMCRYANPEAFKAILQWLVDSEQFFYFHPHILYRIALKEYENSNGEFKLTELLLAAGADHGLQAQNRAHAMSIRPICDMFRVSNLLRREYLIERPSKLLEAYPPKSEEYDGLVRGHYYTHENQDLFQPLSNNQATLYRAIRFRDTRRALILLDQLQDDQVSSFRNSVGDNLLHAGIEAQVSDTPREGVVRCLLSRARHLADEPGQHQWTALHIAARKGYFLTIDELLCHKITLDDARSEDFSALVSYCQMLEQSNHSAIQISVRGNHVLATKVLIQYGALENFSHDDCQALRASTTNTEIMHCIDFCFAIRAHHLLFIAAQYGQTNLFDNIWQRSGRLGHELNFFETNIHQESLLEVAVVNHQIQFIEGLLFRLTQCNQLEPFLRQHGINAINRAFNVFEVARRDEQVVLVIARAMVNVDLLGLLPDRARGIYEAALRLESIAVNEQVTNQMDNVTTQYTRLGDQAQQLSGIVDQVNRQLEAQNAQFDAGIALLESFIDGLSTPQSQEFSPSSNRR